MPSILSANASPLLAQRQLSKAQEALLSASARLSTGLRANVAQDHSAALAAHLASKTKVEPVAATKSDAVTRSQVQEAHLSSTSDVLKKMRDITLQTLDVSVSAADRDALNVEFSTLKSEALRIGEAASNAGGTLAFGGAKLDQSQVSLVGGGGSDDGILTRSYDGYSLTSGSFSVSGSSTQEQRQGVLAALDGMISNVGTARYAVSAFQSEVILPVSSAASDEDDGLYTPTSSGSAYDFQADFESLKSKAVEALGAVRSQANSHSPLSALIAARMI